MDYTQNSILKIEILSVTSEQKYYSDETQKPRISVDAI